MLPWAINENHCCALSLSSQQIYMAGVLSWVSADHVLYHHWLSCIVQARNNARAVVTGSIDMFSNEFFSASLGSSRYEHWA